jgi:hypothetical protein
MAISFELERRKAAREAAAGDETREAHPMAWKTKPDTMPES